MFKFIKQSFIGLLLLPFLLAPLNADIIRPIISPIIYDKVWGITSLAGMEAELTFNITSTASIEAWQAEYAPNNPYTRASDMNVFDFEAISKTAGTNVLPVYGGRRVEQLFHDTLGIADAIASAWLKTEGGIGTVTVTDQGSGVFRIQLSLNGGEAASTNWARVESQYVTTDGSDYITSAEFKNNGGASTFSIGRTVGNHTTITITDDWQRYALTSAASNSGRFSIASIRGVGTSYPNNDVDILVRFPLLEGTLAQANTNPSDYIENTSHTASISQYYTTENGNTVSSNVVTEATGPEIVSIMGGAFWPSTTNVIGSAQYRDFTHADWNVTDCSITAGDVVLIDGTTVADKNTLTASGANGTIVLDPYVSVAGVHSGGVFIKRKTGTGAIEVTVDGGTTWVAVTTQVAGDAGWHLCETTLPTIADPEFGVRLVTSGDAVYLDYAQMDDGYKRVSSHPIAGGATLAPQSLIAADATNASKLISDTQGYVIAHAQLMPDDIALESFRFIENGQRIIYGLTPDSIRNYDGTTALTLTNALSGYSKFASYWWGSSKQLTSNGSSVVAGAYDGVWGSGNIYIGSLNGSVSLFNGIINQVIVGPNIKTNSTEMETETTADAYTIPIGYIRVIDSLGNYMIDSNGLYMITPR